MKKAYALFLTMTLFCACNSDRFRVTEDYIHDSKGFSEGFTISQLKVTSFDSTGLPEESKDSIRVDLIPSGPANAKETIWFNRNNPGYFWTKDLKGKYETIPLKFEEGVWYFVWSNNFKTGFFKTNMHKFFIYKDSKGFHVYEKIEGLNL